MFNAIKYFNILNESQQIAIKIKDLYFSLNDTEKKLLLLILFRQEGRYGKCFEHQKNMAKRLHKHKNTIYRNIKKLILKGIITKSKEVVKEVHPFFKKLIYNFTKIGLLLVQFLKYISKFKNKKFLSPSFIINFIKNILINRNFNNLILGCNHHHQSPPPITTSIADQIAYEVAKAFKKIEGYRPKTKEEIDKIREEQIRKFKEKYGMI